MTPEEMIKVIDKLLASIREDDSAFYAKKDDDDEDYEVVDTICQNGKFYELRRKKGNKQ